MVDLIPARIVSSLAELTGQREVALLESGLLKTIDELFSPEWSALYRYEMAGGEHAGTPEFAAARRGGAVLEEAPAASFAALTDMDGVTAVPILSRTRIVLGFLALKRDGGLNAREQQLAAAVFRIYDNYLAVLRESQVDRLTGLLNRHTFDTQLDRALEHARRRGRNGAAPAAAAATRAGMFLGEIDIDHFKKINDRYGHLYGDEVLLIMARLMKANFRKSDLVYRFGGEEFVVIVLAENRAGAVQSFERLRRSVEACEFPQVGRVTINVGTTAIGSADAPVQLLGSADRALYYAKNHGRNRVCCYEELIESGALQFTEAAGELTMF